MEKTTQTAAAFVAGKMGRCVPGSKMETDYAAAAAWREYSSGAG